MLNSKNIASSENQRGKLSKTDYLDIAVYGDITPDGGLSPDTQTLLAKAQALAEHVNVKVALVRCGNGITRLSRALFRFGPDRIFVYDAPVYQNLTAEVMEAVFAHYFENYKPSVVLFPDTAAGSAGFEAARQCTEGLGVKTPSGVSIRSNKDLIFDTPGFERIKEMRPQLVLLTAEKRENLALPGQDGNRGGELILCELPEALR